MTRRFGLFIATAALALLASGGAIAQQPISLAKEGYLFVGGNYVTVNGKQVMSGQAYVEYQIPRRKTQPYPIVIIPGAAQTATNFNGTPDGREGWTQHFLRRGYAVYIIEQPGRGRSGYQPGADGPQATPLVENVQNRFTAISRANLWPQARLHTQWPGTGVAGDPTFDQFYASQVESVASTVKTEELMFPADVALLEKVGPVIVLTHSQSGVFGFKLADTRPDLVKAHVAVEPNGPPFYDIDFKGGEDWYKDSDKIARAWGVARIPLAYEPPATEASELNLVRQEQADGPQLVRCWLQREPARQLFKMKDVPTVIVTGEASFRATYDHCTSKFLSQARVPNTHLRLEKTGLLGNGHMMMLEHNSAVIAGAIGNWLEANIK